MVLGEGTLVGLRDEDGGVTLIRLIDDSRRIKGLGVMNTFQRLSTMQFGDNIQLGRKSYALTRPRLPEIASGMRRGAQTISAKDAGLFITRMGIGAGDRVLEAGIGSGGLSIHILRALGDRGELISVENRSAHAETALSNISDAIESMGVGASHDCLIGDISEVADGLKPSFDAVILDLPDHPSAVAACAPLLTIGGRIGCYCPVSTQLEKSWEACEEAGLEVEWAGELMEREWGRASRGGMRPVNGPFGHTAFLLIAVKAASGNDSDR